MGKVNKRQRKFLSKKVLPHRKKGGVRRDNKPNKGSNKGGGEDAPAPAAGEQQRKTLPDGVDTATFLECGWLSRAACAAAARDSCVTPFEPDAALLEAAGAQAKRGKSGKGGKHSGGLTHETAGSLVARAVDDASMDDLVRVVWALQAAAATSATTSPPSASGTPGQALRAAPGSQAVKTLRIEAFSRLHLAFRAHLGPEREEGDSLEEWEDAVRAHRQHLEKAEAWPKLGGALLSFLTTALDHVQAGAEESPPAAGAAGASATPLVEGLARMKDHVPLLFPFPRLARRYLVFLLSVLESADDAAALSLAFVRMYELSTSQPMPFLHDAFKGAYRCYRAAAERIGAGGKGAATAGSAAGGKARSGGAGAGSLPLLRECFAELFGVEKPSAYLVRVFGCFLSVDVGVHYLKFILVFLLICNPGPLLLTHGRAKMPHDRGFENCDEYRFRFVEKLVVLPLSYPRRGWSTDNSSAMLNLPVSPRPSASALHTMRYIAHVTWWRDYARLLVYKRVLTPPLSRPPILRRLLRRRWLRQQIPIKFASTPTCIFTTSRVRPSRPRRRCTKEAGKRGRRGRLSGDCAPGSSSRACRYGGGSVEVFA